MTANAIASNLFAQVDQDGQHFVLFDAIIDSRTDGTHIKEGDAFIHVQWKQEEERDHQRMGSLHQMERWELNLEPS